MKVYRQVSLLVMMVLVGTSCKKEIEMDYHSVEPLYVVEAYVTNEGMVADVRLTQDVTDGGTQRTVDDARISVSGTDGTHYELAAQGNGHYVATACGRTGVTYTLTARMGEVTATARSTMQDSVVVDSCKFVREEMIGTMINTFEMNVRDDGEELRNYLVTLYRKGEPYLWKTNQNKQSVNGGLKMQMICFREKDDAEEADKERYWLDEGETVTGTVTRLDTPTYDYYYSWTTASRTETNPITNFSGGVQGVFVAKRVTRFEVVYHCQ